ncbi:paired amphipathic helix protein Sin3-like 3 isoform X2 [Salvia miltiorrhiza]|uniref:paired amphipathic helix protein Sin3-like 3 isoform X2 n=1 Tax=Salvia miltiorrhiza TaxID=226208 RepID=UPI0025AC7E80|nr:paired amphipathic helix protein Sin3-like 3 isoform X2 [Salvia miltiorrhiza]
MKRSRDDVFVSSMLKGSAIPSPTEPSGQAQMSTARSAQKLQTTDALSYLKVVKEKFQDKGDNMYNEFLAVMKEFKAQRIDTSGVIVKVKELFRGDRDLILGFNAFLPKGYEITLPPEDEPLLKKKPVDFEEAIGFVNKIKTRFQGDHHVYNAFLDILNIYRKNSISITEVYQEVSVLFQDHADLLVEFTHFLPYTTAAPAHHAQPVRNNILLQNSGGSPMTLTRPIEQPAAGDQFVTCPDPEQLRVNKKENKAERDDDDNLDSERKYAGGDDSASDQLHKGTEDPVSIFCGKVKERLKDSENYKKFLDCVRSYRSKFVTLPQFQMLVASILGSHPDLKEQCEDFIIYIEKIGSKQNFRSQKVDDREADEHNKEDSNKNKDHDNRERDRSDKVLAFNKDVQGQKLSITKEKYMAKPIHELDLSNCESCTPSYRLLPNNYPIPSVSCRTKIGSQVLNDHWVSVTSGSEDYSFKHMRKNQYEESLFRCEDDRFELDMLLESVNATTKRVEELLDSMNSHTDKTDSTFHIDDHLTAVNLRCIERLYGDHGLDVRDVLRKNAPLALPVILTRLKQKQEEWARCRSDFNKIWAEIYARNYHKSLDHRSFYFKQQDTKNLSAKAFLAEIREISEKDQNEDEKILSISAGYRQPIKPHMKFEYPDPDIQEDLYQLMKYACGEVCTPEQQDKVMRIWTTFLEPVFSIPSRPSVGDIKETVNNDSSKRLANFGEGNGTPVGEAASENRRSLDMSKTGGENFPTEQSRCSRILMVDNGVKNGGSPSADNAACEIDVSRNATQNGVMRTDASSTIPAMSGNSKQAGFFEQVTPNASGEKNINVENGSSSAIGDRVTTVMLNNKPQGGLYRKVTSSSVEGIHTQKCHNEIIGFGKGEREEGELSPSKNHEDNILAAFGEVAYSSCKSADSVRRTGGEALRVVEAGGENDANADDEGEESAKGSSDSENGYKIADVSATDSADREERSPGDHDEDEDHDENDNKDESEREGEGVADIHENEGTVAFSGHVLNTVKPLTTKLPTALPVKERNSEIFYGNDSFYLLFRLHQILYERMHSAKLHSSSPENKWRILNDSNTTDSYARFKDALHSLLDGSSDNAKFEDDCRTIIGAQSYILFSLDKLIHKLVKQLQTIASEEMENKLIQLYSYERSRSPRKFVDDIYHENARFLLPEDNLYRIECVPSPTCLTAQLMKNEQDKPEETAIYMDPAFAAYLNGELLSVAPERKGKHKIFLKRNKRKFSTQDKIPDISRATEQLVTYNGLEIKVACNTLKAAYVIGTEDFLYRLSKRRKTPIHSRSSSSSAPNGCSQRVRRICRLMVS